MTRPPTDDVVARVRRAASRSPLHADVEDVQTMPGGHSGITLRARLAPTEGPVRDVVVKLTPPGRPAVGRHDVLRQARALRALASVPGLAIPTVVFEDHDDPPLFAMDLIPGQSAEPVLDGPGLPMHETKGRSLAAARMLARLHDAPLSVLSDEPALTLSDELARWKRTMDAVPAELVPDAPTLFAELVGSTPHDGSPTVVHGDYRLGNTLCADEEVCAIIDWEIWSVGDPRVDLGWFRMFCEEENFPGVATPAPGLPSVATLLEEYERARGVMIADIAWFDAFASYKMAAIMGHNLRRHREGRHHDPYQEQLVPTISRLVERGRRTMSGSPAPRR